MRILVVSNLYPPHYLGGYELRCRQVCKGLSERGHEITVLTSTHGVETPLVDGDDFDIWRHLRLVFPFGTLAAEFKKRRLQRALVGHYNYARMRELIIQKKPDIVFIWSQLRLTLACYRAALDAKVPVACSLGDEHLVGYRQIPFKMTPRRMVGYVLDRSLFRGGTLSGLTFKNVHCLSNRLKSNLLAAGIPIPDARVVYRGIPLDVFTPKDEIGRIGAPVKLLYVGQLLPEKGVHTLLEAANGLSRTRPAGSLTVSVVGHGPEAYRAELAQLARQGNYKVTFYGKLTPEHIPGVYREHDILIFPSIGAEGYGVTHLEAMASGTTVISTRGGGQDELISDRENALVYEKANAEELASCISELVEKPELSKYLAENALRMVQEKFSMEKYIAAMECFLKDSLDE